RPARGGAELHGADEEHLRGDAEGSTIGTAGGVGGFRSGRRQCAEGGADRSGRARRRQCADRPGLCDGRESAGWLGGEGQRGARGRQAYNIGKMASLKFSPKPHADVLRRGFDLPGRGMTRALAEGILDLDFPDRDAARIEELNAKANESDLTGEEEAELEAY